MTTLCSSLSSCLSRCLADVDYSVHLESSGDAVLSIVSEVCKTQSKEVFHRTKNSGSAQNATVTFSELPRSQGLWATLRSISPELPDIRDALDILSQYAIYAPQVDFLRGQVAGGVLSELTAKKPVGLHGERLPDAVESLLDFLPSIKNRPESDLQSKALQLVFLPGWANMVQVGRIDDSLISRAVRGKGENIPMLYFEDKYMEDRKKRLSVYDSSEGTLFLLFIAALLVHFESPRIFALDNVDNALNPAMTRKYDRENNRDHYGIIYETT